MGQQAHELKTAWLSALKHERRASPHTLIANDDDISRYLAFLQQQLGGAVVVRALVKLSAADIRAVITRRRTEGLGPRGVQRALAAIRGFFRYLAREGIADNAAPRAVRTPRIPRTLPRPLSVDDAARTIAEAGTRDIDWLAARDTALLTLLYGAGLRRAGALGRARGGGPGGAARAGGGGGGK